MRILESIFLHAIIGAVLGALTGIASIALLALPSWGDGGSSWLVVPLLFGPMVGAPIGAVAAPILGGFVLRRVPVKQIVRYTPIGTLCGAYVTLLVAWLVADISDGLGIPYLIAGGVVGLVATSLVLRARFRHVVDVNPMW